MMTSGGAGHKAVRPRRKLNGLSPLRLGQPVPVLFVSSMAMRIRNPHLDDVPFTGRKAVPHEFVLDALAPLSPETRPLFSCLAVYVGDKIIFALRDKQNDTADDNGVWVATTVDHHKSLQQDFPSMRSIRV